MTGTESLRQPRPADGTTMWIPTDRTRTQCKDAKCREEHASGSGTADNDLKIRAAL